MCDSHSGPKTRRVPVGVSKESRLPWSCVTWPGACWARACWAESCHIPPRCTGCSSSLLWSTPWRWVWWFPVTGAQTLGGTDCCQRRCSLCPWPPQTQPCFCVDSPHTVSRGGQLRRRRRQQQQLHGTIMIPRHCLEGCFSRHCGLLGKRHFRFNTSVSIRPFNAAHFVSNFELF